MLRSQENLRAKSLTSVPSLWTPWDFQSALLLPRVQPVHPGRDFPQGHVGVRDDWDQPKLLRGGTAERRKGWHCSGTIHQVGAPEGGNWIPPQLPFQSLVPFCGNDPGQPRQGHLFMPPPASLASAVRGDMVGNPDSCAPPPQSTPPDSKNLPDPGRCVALCEKCFWKHINSFIQ